MKYKVEIQTNYKIKYYRMKNINLQEKVNKT